MYNDESIMPFGIHKGKKLEDVPASYLVYLLDSGLKAGPLKDYIIDNKDVLQKQMKEDQFKRKYYSK
jgi:uncharacterized protein (DUF3820 family)